MRPRIVLLLLTPPAFAWAGTLTGRVVGVHDGDTITLLVPVNVQYKIRLRGIDELRQPFGNRSRENLSRLAYGKKTLADSPKVDKYRRKVCRVTVSGQDVGLDQVEAGRAAIRSQ